MQRRQTNLQGVAFLQYLQLEYDLHLHHQHIGKRNVQLEAGQEGKEMGSKIYLSFLILMIKRMGNNRRKQPRIDECNDFRNYFK